MKIKEKDARLMLTALGFGSADDPKTPVKRIQTQIANLAKLLNDLEQQPEEGSKAADLFKDVKEAFENDEEVELVAEGGSSKPAADKKGAAKAGKSGSGKKPAKGGKSGENRGPGVIDVIAEVLKGASKKKPVSKDDIVKQLAKRFTDRDPEKMRKTVNAQVPSRIARDRKIKVQSSDDGYWAE